MGIFSGFWRLTGRLILFLYSPLSAIKLFFFGPMCRCRFHPTCSQYARECIGKYGVWHSFSLVLRRLCRCHPWNRGGYDPVP
ncbi:MAG: membrane protein insertion efficiency factor YidD [Puniceicoccales bacterium]|nr:membrane protein insertion efficiency factor YidD [Puniceicoccales bacterium]